MHPPDERHLRAVLRDEAERHHPDRAAMLSRIHRGRAAAPERPMSRRLAEAGTVRTRPAAAAFAIVLLLVLGIAGVRLFTPGPATPDIPVAAPTTTTTPPAGTRSPSPPPVVAAPGTTAPSTTGRPDPPASTPATTPASAAPPARDGFLSATGGLDPHSIAGWAQSNVTLTAAETLTTLKVTVRIAHTDGVADTGHWTSIPAGLIATTVTEDDHELVYRFALADGATLTPGRYTFAVQYNHAAGARALTGDSFLAAGRGISKQKAEVTGGFAAR